MNPSKQINNNAYQPVLVLGTEAEELGSEAAAAAAEAEAVVAAITTSQQSRQCRVEQKLATSARAYLQDR